MSNPIEVMARAIAEADAKRPFGGYNYGHNEDFYGPAPKAGSYVVRAEFSHSGYKRGQIAHQTNSEQDHEETYRSLTETFVAQAALKALSDAGYVIVPKVPTEGMIDAGERAWAVFPCDETEAIYTAMIAAAQGER